MKVSEVSLGAVQLGMNYGFPGTDHYDRPDEKDSIRLLQRAVDLGVNLLDTARGYGVSEEIIGKALVEMDQRPHVVSKLTTPPDPGYSGIFPSPPDNNLSATEMRRAILGSIESSLKALQIDTIDVMLIHNTTMESLRRDDIIPCLEEACEQGKIRYFGASTYGEDVPLEILKRDCFRAMQVPLKFWTGS